RRRRRHGWVRPGGRLSRGGRQDVADAADLGPGGRGGPSGERGDAEVVSGSEPGGGGALSDDRERGGVLRREVLGQSGGGDGIPFSSEVLRDRRRSPPREASCAVPLKTTAWTGVRGPGCDPADSQVLDGDAAPRSPCRSATFFSGRHPRHTG